MIENMKEMEVLLDRYRLSRPVPPKLQKHIQESTRKNLVRLLKEGGLYTPFFALVLYLFFALKKVGIYLSLVKLMALVSFLCVVSMATVASAFAISTNNLFNDEQRVVEPVNKTPEKSIRQKEKDPFDKRDEGGMMVSNGENGLPGIEQTTVLGKGDIIVFQKKHLKSVNVEEDVPSEVYTAIFNELRRLRGKSGVAASKSEAAPDKKKLLLFASVEKVKKMYMLSVLAIDSKTGEVKFKITHESTVRSVLKKGCKKLAREIVSKVRVL
ncbi:MAG: hypothetical protein GY754_28760 [bacterium]|nr:hypothetical protein [bacterium]